MNGPMTARASHRTMSAAMTSATNAWRSARLVLAASMAGPLVGRIAPCSGATAVSSIRAAELAQPRDCTGYQPGEYEVARRPRNGQQNPARVRGFDGGDPGDAPLGINIAPGSHSADN